MESAHFFSKLVLKLYKAIQRLYDGLGNSKRVRDISKLIESFTSITNLTIDKNDRVPFKT
jgi:hypothetical protein